MDKPFIEEEWIASERDWSKYIPKISSLPNFKGMTFADSTVNYIDSKQTEIFNETQLIIPEDELKISK